VEQKAIRRDSAAVAGNGGVDPVVINIAIEDFQPVSRNRESELMGPPGILAETKGNDDILSASV